MYPVSKARKILGKRYSHLTNKEVEQIIIFLERLCNRVIEDIVSGKYKKS